MSKQGLILLALLAAAFAGCTEDPLYPRQAIEVSGVDMPALAGDAVYELWLSYPPERVRGKENHIDHDEPVYFSAGRFVIGANGAITVVDGGPAAFAIPSGYNPSLVGEALLSVEPRNDDDSIPDAPMLWGVFLGSATRGHAILELASPRTFDTSAITMRHGVFALEAPTSSSPADSVSGIWFVDHRRNQTSGEPFSPGIEMPAMPLNHDNDRWIYEAWLSVRGVSGIEYLSLGRFRNPARADQNGPGPATGPNIDSAYGLPGEDFIVPRRVLADSTYGVVVSLQPEDIPLRAPLVRVLERAAIADTVGSGVTLSMTATVKLPLLEVTIER